MAGVKDRVAHAVASDEASYITGHTLAVTGGLLMRMPLEDVTVLDLSHALAGPFCSTIRRTFPGMSVPLSPRRQATGLPRRQATGNAAARRGRTRSWTA